MKTKTLLFACAGLLSTTLSAQQDIDLVVDNGGFTFNSTTNEITIIFDVKNTGTEDIGFNSGARVAFYLSTDTVFDGSDYLITYSGLSYGVFAGQCYCSNSVPFDLDDVNAPSGKYYVLIIADDLGKVAETNENNNLINGGTVDYQGGGSNPTAITNNIFDNNKTQLKNYPNPFYSTTYFKFKIIQDEHVTLTIIDVLGKEVAQLVDRHLTTGEYVFPFDASHLPAGVYYYKATTNNTIQTRKVMIIR